MDTASRQQLPTVASHSESLFDLVVHHGPALERDGHPFNARVCSTLSGFAGESLTFSRINHILRIHDNTILKEHPQRRPVRNWLRRARDIAAPAHLGAFIEVKQRIQGLIANDMFRRPSWGLHGPDVTSPTNTSLEHTSSASQDEDSDDIDFSPTQVSCLRG